jgi:hypothetical protein
MERMAHLHTRECINMLREYDQEAIENPADRASKFNRLGTLYGTGCLTPGSTGSAEQMPRTSAEYGSGGSGSIRPASRAIVDA